MNNVALLVFACDRYELLYKGFDYFFKKHWDSSLTIKQYFSTEEKSIDIDGFTNILSGKGEWTNRLKKVLNQIEEEYIIFFQEDMWMSKPVQEGVLKKILAYTISNNLSLVKLHSSEVYKTDPIGINIEGLLLTKVIKEKSDFLMSHQVSIWNKEFLIQQLHDNEHPWRNERKGSKRLKKSKTDIYQIDFISENGKPAINNNSSKKILGEYQTISANACLEEKTMSFVNQLEEEHIEYANKLRFHIENNITHAGKSKPRKVDFFKKIKTFFASKFFNRN